MSNRIIRSVHGGGCCGMTHIWHFPDSPSPTLPAHKALTGKEYLGASAINPGIVLQANESYPSQTAGERLRDALKRIDSERSQGIVEAVLTQHQTPFWQKTLESNGFKLVNENKNSNSGNRLFVFHRNT